MKRYPVMTATVLCVAVLTSCAPTVAVPVAPDATEPVCASVVLATPDTLLDLPRIRTTSQATTAWGAAGAAVTLRCGVEAPGPSADCLAIDATGGREAPVDWIATQTTSGWSFVTYGRSPAVQVQVPDSAGLGQPSAVLADLGGAVALVSATERCS